MSTVKRVRRRKLLMNKLKHKYRLVFFNDNTFEEVWHLRLSLLNVLAVVGTISAFLITLVVFLMAFTSLREFIPGYPDQSMQASIMRNAMRLDSIENEIRIRDQYSANLNALISGQELSNVENPQDSAKIFENIKFTKSIHDSLLRQRVEEEEQFDFSVSSSPKLENSISEMHFLTPIKGLVTNSYNASENHFGVDIVASPNEVVKATLDGTVILATWTAETGNIIQIQHQNNIVSVYKHNASLLKRTGSQVKAGDAIAIIGNSGELTTGPHLHFELWHNGKPINPADFIIFN